MSNRDPVCCFKEWMSLQEQDLCELLQALNLDADRGDDSPDDGQLRQLIAKSIEHFEEYMSERVRLAREYHVSTFFVPGWCTLLEFSMLWIAGCRPSIFIRLLYALIGEDFESQLDEYIPGRITGTLGAVSPIQMNSINSLHAKTIREEDKLSTRLASLQEYVADDPIAIIARQSRTYHGEPCKEIREALDEHAKSMLSAMGEADILRLKTLKELISILTPVQAANFLAAGKKLHLCLHEWSKATENLNGHRTILIYMENAPEFIEKNFLLTLMGSPSCDVGHQSRCFQEWLILEELDLSEMLEALNIKENGDTDQDVLLRQLVTENIEHFQTYIDQRAILARDHVSPFFAPPWCSTLECSLLWLGGCRPSVLIRLILALSGQEIETHVVELLEGDRSDLGDLWLSASQLAAVNSLQSSTTKHEDKLSAEMASLQEKIADQPIASIVKSASINSSVQNGQLDEALDEHAKSMMIMFQKADKFRLQTLKELVNILSPVQAVDFLAAGKRFHLCVHNSGKHRDRSLAQ